MRAKSGMSLERAIRMRSRITLFKPPGEVSDGVVFPLSTIRRKEDPQAA